MKSTLEVLDKFKFYSGNYVRKVKESENSKTSPPTHLHRKIGNHLNPCHIIETRYLYKFK